MQTRRNEIDFMFTDCVNNGDSLFFYSLIQCALLKMNLKTKEIEFIQGFFIGDKRIDSIDFIFYDNKYFYMLCVSEKKWIKYSLIYNTYQIRDLLCKSNIIDNIINVSLVNNKIYIFESFCEKIIELNLYDMTTKYRMGFPKEFNLASGKRIDNIVWFITKSNKVIIKYLIKIQEYFIFYLPGLGYECIDILIIDNSIYVLNSYGEVFLWIIGSDDVEKLIDLEKEKNYFGRFIVVKEKIIMLPKYGRDIYIYDLVSKKVSEYKEYPIDFQYRPQKGIWKYFEKCEDEKFYYFAMLLSNYMLCISKENASIKWEKILQPSLESLEAFFKNKNNLFLLERGLQLHNYILIIKKRFCITKRKKDLDDIGKNIWKKIKN